MEEKSRGEGVGILIRGWSNSLNKSLDSPSDDSYNNWLNKSLDRLLDIWFDNPIDKLLDKLFNKFVEREEGKAKREIERKVMRYSAMVERV